MSLLVVLGAGSCSSDEGRRDRGRTDRDDGRGTLLTELAGWELTFLAVRDGREPHLYLANADGSNIRQLDRFRGDKQTPNWSPDGRRVALRWVPSDYDDPTPLLVLRANGTKVVDLSKKTGLFGWSPSWSPDGTRVVAAARRRGEATETLYVVNADGSDVDRLTPAGREAQYASWSPTGDLIAFTYVEAGGFDIYTIRPDGSGERRLTNDGAAGENNWAMWSPDGKKIAWGRGDSIWIMSADGSNKRMVTDAGGVPGAWAPAPFITFQCETDLGVGICAVREDGTGLTTLLGGMEAGFPGWRPLRQ
ncbi:MAG: DPP IV N-terminal domain-containing protein [Actinomycetota bacterium]|nr:DPP IV N-terminal domain-containing protein [Actinomycetota bacterium]